MTFPVKAGKKKQRPALRNQKTKDVLFCLLLLLPAIVLCITFIIIPIIDSVIMSFQDYRLVNLTQNIPGEWNGFSNYTRLWESGRLQSSIMITVFFVVVTVVLTFVIALTLALILEQTIWIGEDPHPQQTCDDRWNDPGDHHDTPQEPGSSDL